MGITFPKESVILSGGEEGRSVVRVANTTSGRDTVVPLCNNPRRAELSSPARVPPGALPLIDTPNVRGTFRE